MKLNRLFITLILVAFLQSSCKDEEDPSTVVGTWQVVTHKVEQVRSAEVVFEATYFETGIYRFNNDGTGFILLDVPVMGLPTDQDIRWEADSVGRITINYNDGLPVHRFNPSYRGDFLFLQGTQISGSLTNLLFTNSEIFFRRQ
jgi:hypothetical protein